MDSVIEHFSPEGIIVHGPSVLISFNILRILMPDWHRDPAQIDENASRI
jgi:hypothetical protein